MTRFGTGNISVYLTIVRIKDSPTSSMCIEGGGGTYTCVKMRSESCRLPRRASRRRLVGLMRRLGTSRDMGKVLMRLPMPSRVSRSGVVHAVSPSGSMSKFRPMDIKEL